jgi:hypothetical protein
MNLNHYNKNNLLKRLPDLKLPYDNIHKKVFSDLYVLIPKGKKHIVWFTYFQDKRVCIFIEVTLGGQKQINEMFIVPQSYDKKLVLGTLFFGTVFNIDKKKYYSIENIHYYKGKNIENNNEKYKLSLIKHILEKELKSCFLTNKGICMAMPIIESKFENCVETAKLLSYKIHSIQNRNLHGKNNNYSSTLFKQIDDDVKSKIFTVKAQLQNDVYDLYYYKSGELKKYDIAYIPDYKTSTMMNNIFRKIKENLNLDALEESDDEEEFENINEDKYVDLNKCVKMECEFNKKFNKFVPIKIMENGKVCNIKEIK